MMKLTFKIRYVLLAVGILSCAPAVMCMQLQRSGLDERRGRLDYLIVQRDILMNRLNGLTAAHTHVVQGGQGLWGQQTPDLGVVRQGVFFTGFLFAAVEREKNRVAFEYFLLRDGKSAEEISEQERAVYQDQADNM